MTNKAFERIMLRIDKALVKAVIAGLSEIEKEARKAIKANPDHVLGYTMAMGSASFKVKWSEDWDGEPMPREENLHPSELSQCGINCQHADNIAKLLDEYNGMLRFTGYPLKLERDPTGKLIKLNDW